MGRRGSDTHTRDTEFPGLKHVAIGPIGKSVGFGEVRKYMRGFGSIR